LDADRLDLEAWEDLLDLLVLLDFLVKEVFLLLLTPLVGTAKLVSGARARVNIKNRQRIIFLTIQYLLGYGPLRKRHSGLPLGTREKSSFIHASNCEKSANKSTVGVLGEPNIIFD
jgi:hypothetical protein